MPELYYAIPQSSTSYSVHQDALHGVLHTCVSMRTYNQLRELHELCVDVPSIPMLDFEPVAIYEISHKFNLSTVVFMALVKLSKRKCELLHRRLTVKMKSKKLHYLDEFLYENIHKIYKNTIVVRMDSMFTKEIASILATEG